MPLVYAEAERWQAQARRFDSVAALTRDLSDWLSTNHPPRAMKPGSIESAFRRGKWATLLDQLCPPHADGAQRHGYPRASLPQMDADHRI
jgi:hypothetical protein